VVNQVNKLPGDGTLLWINFLKIASCMLTNSLKMVPLSWNM